MNIRRWAQLLAGGCGALVIASAVAGWYEGTRLKAYQDVGGVWTICMGHTAGVKANDTATLAECQAKLDADMAAIDRRVQACIERPMTPGQRVAFDDLAYNVGWPTFCRSSVARKFNRGDVAGACAAIKLYVHAGGQILRGLVKRRQAEYELCTG